MKFIFLMFSILVGTDCLAQQEPLLNLLNRQVAAFNQRDVNQLVANVADDFKWFYLTADTILLEVASKEQFRKSMEAYYASGLVVNTTIESSTVDGNRISFKEVVRYQNKKGEAITSSAMGIYEIRENKIYRAWYFID